MAFLKKRSTAILVFAVVFILASLFAINRSLGEKAEEVRDQFADGVYDEVAGYKRSSIKSQLDVRAAASQNLISVGSRYADAAAETSALRTARTELVNGLEAKKMSPKYLFAANKSLQEAFDALDVKLRAVSLTSSQKTIVADSETRMQNAARVIGEAGYNEAVRGFDRKTLSRFPTNFLKTIAFLKEPELFE